MMADRYFAKGDAFGNVEVLYGEQRKWMCLADFREEAEQIAGALNKAELFDEMRDALELLERAARVHTFITGTRLTTTQTDCDECGKNFRHDNHWNTREGPPREIRKRASVKARAILAKVNEQ